jgi:GGDEF domain-containing protein
MLITNLVGRRMMVTALRREARTPHQRTPAPAPSAARQAFLSSHCTVLCHDLDFVKQIKQNYV